MIPLFKVFMSPGASQKAAAVLQSGYIGQGPVVEQFEQALRERFEHDYVLTTNSCTSALHLALHLLKQGSGQWPGLVTGDEVLTSPVTCVATNWPILANGLRIKWVDVSESDLNLDLQDLDRKLTPSTKVIILVHWGGNPIDLDRVRAIQDRAEDQFGFRPAVVEDCAHAFGSTYKSRALGTHGNIACYSFQAIKSLTCGDGGALLLPTQELFERARLLRWYGVNRAGQGGKLDPPQGVTEWGFKFHMNDINAAIGLENLKVVDAQVIRKHQENADYLRHNLANIPGVTLLSDQAATRSAHWIFTLRVKERPAFIQKLSDAGIEAHSVHHRNDKYECVDDYRVPLPVLDRTDPTRVCIPCGWWVSEKDRAHIVSTIKAGW